MCTVSNVVCLWCVSALSPQRHLYLDPLLTTWLVSGKTTFVLNARPVAVGQTEVATFAPGPISELRQRESEQPCMETARG